MKNCFIQRTLFCLIIAGGACLWVTEKINNVKTQTGKALGKIAGVVQTYEVRRNSIATKEELIRALQSSNTDISPCRIENGTILDAWNKELVFNFIGSSDRVLPFVTTQPHLKNYYTSASSSYGRPQLKIPNDSQ